MFGKSKKNASTKPQSGAPEGARVNRPDVGDGELILESLFVEERPESKASKFAALAEDAEYVEVKTGSTKEPRPADKPVKAKAASEKAASKAARPRLFSGLFAKRPAPAKPASHAVKPGEHIDLNLGPIPEGEETLELEIQAQMQASTAAAAERYSAKDSGGSKRSFNAPKAPKPKRSKRSRRKARKGCYIVTQIGGERFVFWRLTVQGVESVDSVPADACAVSFSNEDYRFAVENRLTARQAQAEVLQEVGDAVQVLNCSKDLRAVYATLQSRLKNLNYRIGPGQLAVDRLFRERAPDASALVVSLELKDLSGRDALLILFYLSASGRMSAPQISVYPDNRDFLLSQFAATHQAARENAQVLLLTHEDLFSVTQDLALYPNEPEFAGVSVRKIWTHAAALSALVASACVVWAYQGYSRSEHAKRSLARVQNSVELLKRANTDVLGNAPRALAKSLSLQVDPILERAHQVWIPGSRVQIVADGTGADYRVTLPLMDKSVNRTTAINSAAARTLLHLPVPADCERGSLNFSGAFNEAQLNIRCEAAPLLLDQYRDR